MSEGVLKEKSFMMATRIVKLYKYLLEEKKEFVMSKQMLRCGTSVGANVREAQSAESLKDFIHKLSVAQKECNETLYWLELLEAGNFLTSEQFGSIYSQSTEVMKLITSSIVTSKKKINERK